MKFFMLFRFGKNQETEVTIIFLLIQYGRFYYGKSRVYVG